MKRSILAALALLALASCAKDNSATDVIDPTTPVAATFSGAAITRVADNKWETGDQIGISMTVSESEPLELADGDYENVAYSVGDTGATTTFSPTAVESGIPETIYYPVDGTEVDFYAYYPYSDTAFGDDGDLAVSVATQTFSAIDVLWATAEGKSKSNSTVTFSDGEDETDYDGAFEHQLSKLTITLKTGTGITDLKGVTTTIKGQYTEATFNIYTGKVTPTDESEGEILAVTDENGTKAEAILIPTSKIANSSIVFTLGGNGYTWDTSGVELKQGYEHTYEITVNKTGITVSGAEISGWNTSSDGTITGTAQ